MKKTFLTLAGLTLATMAHAEDPHVRVITSICFNCHGPNGVSAAAIPGMAGQDKAYLIKTMKDQKSGAIETTVMKKFMMGFSDAEIEAMADYFSKQK